MSSYWLDEFGENTLPMLDCYAERERLLVVDGTESVDEVSSCLPALRERLNHG